MHQEPLTIILSFAFLFAVGAIGSDMCLGWLTHREYLIAREDWVRDGGPTWWPWQPRQFRQWLSSEFHVNNAPRIRWLFSTPGWVKRDRTAWALHTGHRILTFVALASWITLMWVLIRTSGNPR